jgi:hypothetical protein
VNGSLVWRLLDVGWWEEELRQGEKEAAYRLTRMGELYFKSSLFDVVVVAIDQTV